MAELTYDNPLSNSDYVETLHGSIHKDNIPYVIKEPFKHKFAKAFLFYSIFIVIFIVIIYIINSYEYYKKTLAAIKASHLETLATPPIKKVPMIVEMSRIKIFNFINPLPINRIVLIDINNNVIDVDTEHNYFVNKYKIGDEKKGNLIDINFGNTQIIKEIILFVDPDKVIELNPNEGKGLFITLDLFNNDNKTWSYSGILSQKENTIKPFKEVFVPLTPYEQKMSTVKPYDELLNSGSNQEILIFNENKLALKLREHDETYEGYY